MINASSLKVMADNANENYGKEFLKEIRPTLMEKLEAQARSGQYALKINREDDINRMNWLSTPHLYKPVIEELKERGFTVNHCDDVRDGTYLIIIWS